MEDVAVLTGDTDMTPFDKGAYASSGTYFTGNAVLKAAQDLAGQDVRRRGGRSEGAARETSVSRTPRGARGKSGSLDFAALAQHCQGGEGRGELVGSASFTTR